MSYLELEEGNTEIFGDKFRVAHSSLRNRRQWLMNHAEVRLCHRHTQYVTLVSVCVCVCVCLSVCLLQKLMEGVPAAHKSYTCNVLHK